MILVADSGSTKCAWALISNGEVIKTITTTGLNPFIVGEEKIAEIILDQLIPHVGEDIGEIHFFGAGCNALGAQRMSIVLSALFPNATLDVRSDLVGAAIAMFGNRSGICCILGTGAASGFFNGSEIEVSTPSLGYILGDEASGCYFGKQLISDYYKGLMPSEMAEKFATFFGKSLNELLDATYRQPFPNRFLASAAPFLSQNISNNYCNRLVISGVRNFISRNLIQYNISNVAVSFTGSVANAFRTQITTELKKLGIDEVNFYENPIENLARFYCKS